MSCCVCEVSIAEETLYQCQSNACNDKIYCESCGNRLHRKKNHKFSDNMKCIYYPDSEEEKHDEQQLMGADEWSKWLGKYRNYTKDDVKMAKAAGITAGVAGVMVAGIFAPVVGAKVAAAGMFATAARSVYTSYNYKEIEENQKNQAMEIALGMFQYSASDTTNLLLFNLEQIKKRYHKFAKFYHPDKKHANVAVFIKINVAQEILLFMADKQTFEFPSNWYLLLEDEKSLIAMESWKEDHAAIVLPEELWHTQISPEDIAPDLYTNSNEAAQVQGGSGIFGYARSMFM